MPAERLADYLSRRAAAGPWRLETDRPGPFAGGVIVPALAESASLPALLDSLAADPSLAACGLLVVIVVNHREDADPAEAADNTRSLALLRERFGTLPFPLGVIDAASPGLALPGKEAGVGLARKLGHDLLLPHLDCAGQDPVLISLDADTLVSSGYARAIVNHFAGAAAGGVVIPFRHRVAGDERENRAIERYELFLRCYVAGLAFAGSPYAFHTVGSAMACRASAYLKCGGMSRRRAGEDFYFLQSLAKTGGVTQVAGAMVYPSPRRSHRVPFGTGRAMGQLLDNEPGAVLFHRPECFELLRRWLQLAADGCTARRSDLLGRAAAISPLLPRFLAGHGFAAAWDGLLRQHRQPGQLPRAFHLWFDAFRTMKFLHFLADEGYPRAEPEAILGTFPAAWGKDGLTVAERLEFLREQQGS
jgi:hypothetical protein